MVSSGSNLGTATLDLRGDLSGLDRSLGRAEKNVGASSGRMGRALKGIAIGAATAGAGIAVGIGAGIAKTIADINATERALRPASERARIAAESLQILSEAAVRAGSEDGLEAIVDTSQELQLQLGEIALTGKGRALEALEALGLESARLQAMKPEEAWRLVVEQIQAIPNVADRAIAAEEIFGGTSEKLAGIINLTSAEFAALEDNVRATTDIWSGETLEASKELQLELQHLRTDLMRGSNAFVAGLLPQLVKYVRIIRTDLVPAYQQLKSRALEPLIAFGRQTLIPFITTIIGSIRAWGEQNQGTFGEFLAVLRDTIWPFLRDTLIPFWVDFMTAKLTLLKTVWDGVLRPVFNALMEALEDLIPVFQNDILPAIQSFIRMMKGPLSDVLGVIGGLLGSLTFTLEGLDGSSEKVTVRIGRMQAAFRRIIRAMRPVLDAFIEIAKFLWPLVTETWEEGVQPMLEQLLELMAQIAESDAFKIFVDGAVVVLKTLAIVIQTTVEIITRALSLVINLLQGDWREAWADVKSIFLEVVDFIGDLLRLWGITRWWNEIWDKMVRILKEHLNNIIRALNTFIRNFNRIRIKVPDWVPGLGGGQWSPNLPEIPQLAEGGIITSPTLALVGEAGPEAVVPLSRMNGAGAMGGLHIHFDGNVYGFDDFTRRVQEAINLGNRRGFNTAF